MKKILFTSFLIGLIMSITNGTEYWSNGLKVQQVTSGNDGVIYVETNPMTTDRCNWSSEGKYGGFVLFPDENDFYKDKLSVLLTAKTTEASVDIYYDNQNSTTKACIIKIIQINEN